MTEGLRNVHIVKLPAQGRELYVCFIICSLPRPQDGTRLNYQILSFDFKQELI